MNTIFLPVAITTWENPYGKLGNRLLGLTHSFGINHWLLSYIKHHAITSNISFMVWFGLLRAYNQ